MSKEKALAWVRKHIQDNPEFTDGERMLMHMDFQAAVHALQKQDFDLVVNALRALKYQDHSANATPCLQSIRLTDRHGAAAWFEAGRLFLLALECNPT